MSTIIHEAVSSKIYLDLKKRIEEFEFKPGEKISEVSLTEIYNVSRTPVKRALSQLEKVGLIVVQPKIATFISKIDTKHIYEFFVVRELLEISVINEVREKISDDNLSLLKINIDKQLELLENKNVNSLSTSKEFWKLDNEFHSIIFSSIDKLFVWEFILNQSSQFNRYRFLSTTTNLDNLTKKIYEHKSIYGYVNKSNDIDIKNLYNIHLFDGLPETISNLESQYPEYF